MLFYFDAPEMFCGLRDFTWLSISMEGGDDDWNFTFLGDFWMSKLGHLTSCLKRKSTNKFNNNKYQKDGDN